jgi:hypothetical protein
LGVSEGARQTVDATMNTLETPQVQKLRERAAELDAAIKTAGMDIEIAQRAYVWLVRSIRSVLVSVQSSEMIDPVD